LIYIRIENITKYIKCPNEDEIQTAQFHTIIASYRIDYNDEFRYLNSSIDESKFLDFINNKNCIFSDLINDFIQERTPLKYHTIISNINKICNILSSEESNIIHALCSATLSQYLEPIIQRMSFKKE